MDRYNQRARFDMSRIIGDPFALATISVAILAWLISFVSSIISDAKGPFPNFAWWALVYMFLCIIGVIVTVAFEADDIYNIAIVGYLSAGTVFTASAVNSLIYADSAAKEASAAGFILLSIVSIIWIAYYGSAPHAPPRMFVDSFALHKSDKSAYRSSRPITNAFSQRTGDGGMGLGGGAGAPQMYTAAQLNGFETSSPVSGYPGGAPGATDASRNSTMARFGNNVGGTMTSATTGAGDATGENAGAAQPPTEYPYRAKAIYSYEANPDDANEISFSKHEILEVSDVSGRWWQAKKENGETGIAPSNYLILLWCVYVYPFLTF